MPLPDAQPCARAIERLALALLLAGLVPTTARSQEVTLQVQPAPGTHAGGKVAAIAESNDGRLWIASHGGLLCHDGSNLRTMASSTAAEPPHLGKPRALAPTQHDTWLSTTEGLWYANGNSGAVSPVEGTTGKSFNSIALDAQGCLWGLTQAGALFVKPPDGAVVEVGATPPVRGLARCGDSVWQWTNEDVRSLSWNGDHAVYERRLALPRVVDMTMGPQGLLLATREGLFACAGDAPPHAVWPCEHCRDGGAIVRSRDATWLLSPKGLWQLPDGGTAVLRVRLFLGGTEVPITDLTTIHADAEGLLWIGSRTGVLRCLLQPGVEHHRIPQLRATEAVTSIVEHEARMWLGTEDGRLLRQVDNAWEELPTPWTVVDHETRQPWALVRCLTSTPHGALIVGTQKRGVWSWRGSWTELVGTEVEYVRGLAAAADGSVWIAAGRGIHHVDGTGRLLERPELPVDCHVGALTIAPSGAIWLATFLGGLYRRGVDEPSFTLVGNSADHGVLTQFAVAPDEREVWLVTKSGLWHLDLPDAASALLLNPVRTNTIRSLARLPDGTLWVADFDHLAHFTTESRTWQHLPSVCSSHPREISHGSVAVRENGEVWMGTDGGFTRLGPQAHHHLSRPPRLGPTTVRIDGVAEPANTTSPHPFDIVAPGATRLVEIQPLVIERLADDRLPYEVVLQPTDGTAPKSSRLGRFTNLAAGNYQAMLTVTRVTGIVDTLHLGRLGIAAPPLVWPWLLTAGALVAAVASLQWRRVRRIRRRNAREIDIAEKVPAALADNGTRSDVAWLAVVACETMMRDLQPRHASAWLNHPATGERIRLAGFGEPCGNAVDRLRDRTRAIELDNRVFLHDRGNCKDLTVCLGHDQDRAIEFLLVDLPRVDPGMLQQIEVATGPLQTSLNRVNWLDRLEHDLAHKTAALEADAHDLRSPLTVLRLTAFELSEQLAAGNLSRTGQTLESLDRAIDNLLASFDHLVANFRRNAGLDLAPANPAQIALRVAQHLLPMAAAKEITLTPFDAVEVDDILVDEIWFARVVENVLGNAVKYSPPRSTIVMHCELGDQGLVLGVEDEGPGMSQGEREAVFLPGVVGAAQPTAGESKTGMGLWIARQALKAMGGRIWIEGRSTGRGACVRICLPRRPPAADCPSA